MINLLYIFLCACRLDRFAGAPLAGPARKQNYIKG
jgi:hypothetical protein